MYSGVNETAPQSLNNGPGAVKAMKFETVSFKTRRPIGEVGQSHLAHCWSE